MQYSRTQAAQQGCLSVFTLFKGMVPVFSGIHALSPLRAGTRARPLWVRTFLRGISFTLLGAVLLLIGATIIPHHPSLGILLGGVGVCLGVLVGGCMLLLAAIELGLQFVPPPPPHPHNDQQGYLDDNQDDSVADDEEQLDLVGSEEDEPSDDDEQSDDEQSDDDE